MNEIRGESVGDSVNTLTEDRSGRIHGRTYGRVIQGQVLRLSARREVAIFLRDGALWIADFIDGHGELVELRTWFRFHCAAPTTTQARRRMVLEAGVPLSTELVARIEKLFAAANEESRLGKETPR